MEPWLTGKEETILSSGQTFVLPSKSIKQILFMRIVFAFVMVVTVSDSA
jgi:hypothetical protein